ncbi:hypothetical protein Bequi_06950 [Brachybacterium sp. JHP9]|uniref:ABC transporter permease n=1 Tax=Brachybacterium equifaecis TaxID=2910770 RepID=A0ABT0R1K3_9MICO|nr:hypothetical protein [Brachybacterium equifaecis]MCL6423124.1 hypothetical protein [Brachybacterium equifaecis]
MSADQQAPGPALAILRGAGRAVRLALVVGVVLSLVMLAICIPWVRENYEFPFEWGDVPRTMPIAVGVAVGALGFMLVPVWSSERKRRTRVQILAFELLAPLMVALMVTGAACWWSTIGPVHVSEPGIWPAAGPQRALDLGLMVAAVSAAALAAGVIIENISTVLQSVVGAVLGIGALAAGPLGLLWLLGAEVSPQLTVALAMAAGIAWVGLAAATLLRVPAEGTREGGGLRS